MQCNMGGVRILQCLGANLRIPSLFRSKMAIVETKLAMDGLMAFHKTVSIKLKVLLLWEKQTGMILGFGMV